MPGKVNPTQAEALTMIANILQSIAILSDGCTNFRKYLVEGTQPNRKKIGEYLQRSLMLVTALSPVIGYDKAAAIAQSAYREDLSLKEAAIGSGFVDEKRFDEIVDPRKMVGRSPAPTA
jgi:fumarate hydratase, class II